MYGPKGIAAMTEHVLAAWKTDIDIRTSGEGARQRVNVETHEIEAGLVYQDANVTVMPSLLDTAMCRTHLATR